MAFENTEYRNRHIKRWIEIVIGKRMHEAKKLGRWFIIFVKSIEFPSNCPELLAERKTLVFLLMACTTVRQFGWKVCATIGIVRRHGWWWCWLLLLLWHAQHRLGPINQSGRWNSTLVSFRFIQRAIIEFRWWHCRCWMDAIWKIILTAVCWRWYGCMNFAIIQWFFATPI